MREDTTAFGGHAGDVVAGFLNPWTLLTVFGIILIAFAPALVLAMLGSGQGAFIVVPLCIGIFGSISLRAAEGELDAGLFRTSRSGAPHSAAAFVGRYIVLNIAWIVPIIAIGQQLEDFHFGSGALLNVGLAAATGNVVDAAIRSLLLLCIICGPSISGIIATAMGCGRFEDLGEIFEWLMSRRRDLVTYYAMLVGGSMVFLALYAIPFGLLLYLLSSVHRGALLGAAFFGWLAPGAAALVLGARMTGAFVASSAHGPEPRIPHNDEGERCRRALGSIGDGAVPTSAIHAMLGVPVPLAPEAAPTLPRDAALRKLDEIKRLFQHEPHVATGKLSALVDENPTVPDAKLLLVLAYSKTNRAADAAALLPSAVQLAIESAQSTDAVKLVKKIGRTVLDSATWTAEQLRALSNACLHEKYWEGAWWCAESAAPKAGVAETARQRWCYEIAEHAARNGAPGTGVGFYKRFLELFPGSTFADFVRKALVLEGGSASSGVSIAG